MKIFSITDADKQRHLWTFPDNGGLVLRGGETTISPEMADRILAETHFDGQRKTDPTFVAMHVENIRRDTWLDGSQIAFCVMGGKFYLVNGKHRVTAISLSGKSVICSIVIYDCKTMDEVRSIYARFDSVVRTRTDAQILSSFGLSEKMGVGATTAAAVYRAIPTIQNGMHQVTNNENCDHIRIRVGVPDVRLTLAAEWSAEAKILDELSKMLPNKLKPKYLAAYMAAAALITLRYSPSEAIPFWTGVFSDDGLRKGDPRKTLITYISINPALNRAGATMIPGTAWNAWYRGDSLHIIRVNEKTPIKFLGTPYTRKGG